MNVKFLKQIREDLGLTRYAMAKALRISQSSYDYYEQSGDSMRLAVLARLQELSGKDPGVFFEMIRNEFCGKSTVRKTKKTKNK